MYRFKELLKTAGWVVKSSGDGLAAFSSTTDVITSGSSGAGGLNNTSAWFRIQSPAGGGTREFTIQRNSSTQVWTIKYSFSAGFTGGSPSSTVLGTATDSQTLFNAATMFLGDNLFRWNAAADNASPYGFFMFCHIVGGHSLGGYPTGAFVMDPMAAGTFPSADNDPVVFTTVGSSAFQTATTTTNFGYLKKGIAGEGFVNIPWLRILNNGTNNVVFPTGAGVNAHSFKEQMFPVCYARDSGQSAPVGWKGASSLMKLCGQSVPTPTLISGAGTRDLVVVGDVVFPWNGSKILI